MSLSVHPDPAYRAGGHGFLQLPGGLLPGGKLEIAIQDAYSERWLHPAEAGDTVANWRPLRHAFGPYSAQSHNGRDWVPIGPEIVSWLEEYTPLRIEIAGQVYTVTWPDTLLPGAAPATPGVLRAAIPKLVEDRPPEPAPPAPPPSTPDPVAPDPLPEPEAPEGAAPKGRGWLLWLIVVLIAAAAIAYVLMRDDSESPDDAAPTETETTEETVDPCASATVLAMDGFDAQIAAVRSCGSAVLPDLALRVIEDAANADNAEALLLFGSLYDESQTDPQIETQIGLTFTDNPGRAAEYYARAARSGSQDAVERLASTCERLAGSKLTLDRSAFDDFCG